MCGLTLDVSERNLAVLYLATIQALSVSIEISNNVLELQFFLLSCFLAILKAVFESSVSNIFF